jgi:hypothetical protein
MVRAIESSPDPVRRKAQPLSKARLALTRQEHGIVERVEIPARTQDAQALFKRTEPLVVHAQDS